MSHHFLVKAGTTGTSFQLAFFLEKMLDISTEINDGRILIIYFWFKVLVLFMLVHFYTAMSYWDTLI